MVWYGMVWYGMVWYGMVCTYVGTYVLTYLHPSIHPSIHTYIHTYLPTYLPTYIHTYERSCICIHNSQIDTVETTDVLPTFQRATRYVGASTLRELPKRTTFIRCTQQLNNAPASWGSGEIQGI